VRAAQLELSQDVPQRITEAMGDGRGIGLLRRSGPREQKRVFVEPKPFDLSPGKSRRDEPAIHLHVLWIA